MLFITAEINFFHIPSFRVNLPEIVPDRSNIRQFHWMKQKKTPKTQRCSLGGKGLSMEPHHGTYSEGFSIKGYVTKGLPYRGDLRETIPLFLKAPSPVRVK